MTMLPCVTCAHTDRKRIDERLHAGASFRAVAAEFGLSKDAVGRHARAHAGITNIDSKKRRAARRRVQRRITGAAQDAPRPKLDTVDDFRAELKRLYYGGLAHLEAAEAAGDGRLAEKALATALGTLQQLGRSIGAFAPDTVVNIDRSQRIVIQRLASVPEEQLRAYLAGDERALPSAIGDTIDGEIAS